MSLFRRLCLVLFAYCASMHLNAAPFPDNIAAWSESTKSEQRVAGKAMLEHIQERVAGGDRVITIQKGDYRFNELSDGKYPAHIIWNGLKDVTLDFQGSTFWFENPRTGLKVQNCENLKIENLFLDWDPLPYIQGKIVALNEDEGTFDFKPDSGYLEASYPGVWNVTSRRRAFVFDPETKDFKDNQVGCTVTFETLEISKEGVFTLKFNGFYEIPLKESGFAVGDPMVILSRMGRAVRSENLVDCTYEDITLYSSPFVAFANWGGMGTTFRRVNIILRPDTSRLMAGNADGINCTNFQYGPLIEECHIRNIGDDFVNLHSGLARVVAQEAPNQIVTSLISSRPKIDEPITLEFFERSTMQRLGTRKVVSVEYIPEWTLHKETTIADLDHRWHSGDAARFEYGKTVDVQRVILDESFEVKGDVIAVCPEFTCKGAIVRNNEFRGSPAKGIRQQTPNVLIENNDVSVTGDAGLSCFGQPSFWGEGPYVFNATIVNNTFRKTVNAASAGSTAAIVVREKGYKENDLSQNIIIRGNRIIETGNAGIIAAGVDGLELVENTIEGFGLKPSSPHREYDEPGDNFGIVLDASTDVLIQGNVIEGAGEFAKGEVFAEDVAFRD